ncbi:hypothetical protein V5R04_10095 [Jonesiaceae bacterium BS-20]|uniref:ABC transmembrane type-1 domain-containing protein n=1 Tax=Jonesiaceae bacterium BS-20 TaxID=3120821 RepID=A0AAU7DRL7_9MICO
MRAAVPAPGAQAEVNLDRTLRAERKTLSLRTDLIPGMDLSFAIAPILVLVWGTLMVSQDLATVGQVTTVLLYAIALVTPIWDLVFWLDDSQVAATSMARIIGVGLVPNDRELTTDVPTGSGIVAQKIRYAYREGHDVLHGINLDLRPSERLAIVGTSGVGQSTLEGCLPVSMAHTLGTVTGGGGGNLTELPLGT